MAEARRIYQAIGELLAPLVVADDGTKFFQAGSERYPAFISHQVEKKCQDKYQGQQVYWRVYPKSAAQGLVFELVTVVDTPEIGVGLFLLQGDWVESGQLQIWRNASPGQVNAHNWRPRLLPISWSDAPAPDESFWQLKAQLVDGALTIIEAAGPFAHPKRLEKLPQLLQSKQPQQQRLGEPKQQPQTKQQAATTSETIDWEDITPVSGFLELTIKFNTLPHVIQANGRCHFKIDCEGRVFQVSVKPKLWAKLETASTTYTQWVAALSGKLGAATADGFVLELPNIQVFELRQSKQPEQPKEPLATAQVQAAATEQHLVTSEPTSATQTAKIPQSKTQAVEATTATQAVEATTAESVPHPPPQKSDPLARPSTPKSESKPKKVGFFNVEIR